MPDKDEILEEIRERFDSCQQAWQDIRDEAQKDMRYISGDPWDAEERRQREQAKRPCLALDELGQYVNELINNVRQNPISIKVSPAGNQATDEKAQFKENMIRGIEYKSKAQSAYTTGFENAAQRSYGAWRISTQYVSEASFDQEIVIKRIPNPDTVWPDYDTKEADSSDMEFCFVTDVMKRSEFKRKYPKAEIKDFTATHETLAPKWVPPGMDYVQIAEYWKVKKTNRTLLMIQDESGPMPIYEDELPNGAKPKILKSRKVEDREVCQYLTNGVEILEEHEWAGEYIPIVIVVGKELYIDDGSGSKRILMSLVRLARDPYMLYCYLRTKEAEEAAMTPLAPYIGYEGQFEGHEEEWQNINKVPIAFAQAKSKIDSAGEEVLPLPTRLQFNPNFAAYEVAAEAARRAIQAAMGTSPLPTAAQRRNEKSGVALKHIDEQQAIGSFHFIDNYKRSIEHTGRILNDLIPKIYDTPRDVPLTNEREKHTVGQLTLDPASQEVAEHQGDYEVTISTGPSFDSQREQANDFLNTIMQNIEQLPLAPDVKGKFMGLLIQLKNLGPIGDEMVKLLEGQGGDPAQAQQQAQAQQKQIAMMQEEIQKLLLEKHGKVIETEGKKQIEIVRAKLDQTKAELDAYVKITVAEIGTKSQEAQVRTQLEGEELQKLHDSAHEVALSAQEHAQAMAQGDQQHAQALEQGEQGHDQAMEQGEQSGQQASDLAQQNADNQPEQQPAQ